MLDYDLHLYEEIMLLAFNDKKGTIAAGTMYNYAVAGAFIAEMLISGRIEIEKLKRRKLVKQVSQTRFDDALLDECMERISTAKKKRTIRNWVDIFAGMKKLKQRTAKKLCRRGILQVKEKDILLIFKQKVYPELNPEPEMQLKERISKTIFSDGYETDERTAAIIALAHHTDLLKYNFPKKKLKKRKKRIEEITKGKLVGDAVKESIEAIRAAIIASTAATTAAT